MEISGEALSLLRDDLIKMTGTEEEPIAKILWEVRFYLETIEPEDLETIEPDCDYQI